MIRNVGTGPGEITPDGCAVEFYALLPPMGESAIVHAAVPEGASILELGCGTRRILRPLADLGHPVLGVDESPAMLARVADLPTVCSPIETLRLDRRFGVVLLASTMLNTEPAQRHAFLATCRWHVDPQGVVVIQQQAPVWFDTVAPSEAEHDGIRRVVQSVHRDGQGGTSWSPTTSATGCGRTRGPATGSARRNWGPIWRPPGCGLTSG